MSRYNFQVERLTIKEINVLYVLSELETAMFFQYLCKLLEKTGIDLDVVGVDEMTYLIDAFMRELNQYFDFGRVQTYVIPDNQSPATGEDEDSDRPEPTSFYP